MLGGIAANSERSFHELMQGVANRIEKIPVNDRLARVFNHVPERPVSDRSESGDETMGYETATHTETGDPHFDLREFLEGRVPTSCPSRSGDSISNSTTSPTLTHPSRRSSPTTRSMTIGSTAWASVPMATSSSQSRLSASTTTSSEQSRTTSTQWQPATRTRPSGSSCPGRRATTVLEVLNDPPEGLVRVEKTYAESTLPQQFYIDTDGLTAMYPVGYLRGKLDRE
jgi:hypothetical protein